VARVARGPAAWAKLALVAAVLLAAAVIPGRATSQQTKHCTGDSCRTPGSILWTRGLPGSWLAESGVAGTVASGGSAYAAVGGGLAAIGVGTAVSAFKATTGELLWQASISRVPVGSIIVGIRAFTGIVAVGVMPPSGLVGDRDEVILAAATGRQIRIYPAAAYGGAIAADSHATVIVGPHAVTAYGNAGGRVLWSRATGPAEEAWRVSGRYVYITETTSSDAGSPEVTSVRRMDLETGAVKRLRPPGSSFAGSLAGAVQGVLLFSAANGVTAYSASNGHLLWARTRSVLELTDPVKDAFYLASGKTLTGIQASTGHVVSQAGTSVSASLYWAADGTALGLDDQGALGQAWGYNLATNRVVWTSSALPWPHFFVDLSGLGGSASPGSGVVLLAICGHEGKALAAAAAPPCLRPELAAVLA
jgi:hypothetical protein